MGNQPTVVLVHGLFGFSKLLWLEYFEGVRTLYESMGLRVITPSLPWAGSQRTRTAALARQLEHESGPLHLVAHSMGGIDARAWISHHDGGEKTASLTTLATPHRGSAAADHVCKRLSPFRIFPGVRNLTSRRMDRFNAGTPNYPTVIYRSYSAKRPLAEQPWIVRRYGRVILRDEGENDSQVSLQSAVWGKHVATLPGDHFELIGKNFWFNPLKGRRPFDPMPHYRAIGEWILALEQ